MTRTREVVGVLGGTFDPVHEGHLAMAMRAQRALRLSRMLMVLTGTPPHKQAATLTPYAQRTAMLELALDGRDGLELSKLESDEDVSYTIDTLCAIRDGTPPRDPVFVMGSDSLLDLPGWRDAAQLVETFDLCVIDRTASDPRHLGDRVARFVRNRLVALEVEAGTVVDLDLLQLGSGGRVFLLPGDPVDVSSSEIRAVVAHGGDPADLVPPAVAGYIQANGLYRTRDAASDPATTPITPSREEEF